MQTFLPYPDFRKSLECLDYRRLGKQRVEAMQIYNTLTKGSRWKNHPAVLMWKGYEQALLLYMNTAIDIWVERGYNNTMKKAKLKKVIMPKWLGKEDFHASHRSNLLRKDCQYYSQYQWKENDSLPYYWPSKDK